MAIDVYNPDFINYKNALRERLRSQAEFQDFDFEGSAMAVLIDLLAYNSSLLGFEANMVASEMFLDSAILRDSVVSRAKAIGYTPRSFTSAKAYINFTITPNGNEATPDYLIIPKGTKFSSRIDDTLYYFSTTNTVIVQRINNSYVASDLEIVEGDPVVTSYTVNVQDQDQKFVIPNAGVDTSTLDVVVKPTENDSLEIHFQLGNDLTKIGPDSNVYFLHEREDGKFEVTFGNGVVGKAVENNNFIKMSYLVSHGKSANKAKTFQSVSGVTGYSQYSVQTVAVADGGADRESIASIKFLAPLSYDAQNRAVTRKDYETVLLKHYPTIDSIKVWGGEDNDPPVYGKVFISIKPIDGFVLSSYDKSFILNEIINPRRLVSVQAEIVDPDYIYLVLECTVKYNSMLTSKSEGEVKNDVVNAIVLYDEQEVNKFDNYFRYSKLIEVIDSSNTSIKNNLTKLKMKYRLGLPITVAANYSINFNNKIDKNFINGKPTLASDSFIFDGYLSYLQDDGAGRVQIYRYVGSEKLIINGSIGAIDYDTGKVTLNNFVVDSIPSGHSYIEVVVRPLEFDIYPTRNQLLAVDFGSLQIDMVDEG